MITTSISDDISDVGLEGACTFVTALTSTEMKRSASSWTLIVRLHGVMLKSTLSGDVVAAGLDERLNAAALDKKWTGGRLELTGDTGGVGSGFVGGCAVLIPSNELVVDIERGVINDSML